MNNDERRQSVVFCARFEFFDQDFIRRRCGKPKEIKHGADLKLARAGEIDWSEWEPVLNVRRRREYWRRVLPKSWSDSQVDQYAKQKAWCGGFALWCLREAGLAADVDWIDSLGFLSKHCKLLRLDLGELPQPGDIAFFQAQQHHAVVSEVRPVFQTVPDGTAAAAPPLDLSESEWDSIDGNQPAIELRNHRPLFAAKAFYSIQPLLDAVANVG